MGHRTIVEADILIAKLLRSHEPADTRPVPGVAVGHHRGVVVLGEARDARQGLELGLGQ